MNFEKEINQKINLNNNQEIKKPEIVWVVILTAFITALVVGFAEYFIITKIHVIKEYEETNEKKEEII